MRHRVARRLIGGGQPPPAGHVPVGDRHVDGAGVGGRRAVDQRQVLPIEVVGAEQLTTGLVGLARQRAASTPEVSRSRRCSVPT